MFTFSKNKEFITGTINGEVFGVNYSKEVFDQMTDLETRLESAQTPTEAKEITEEFKKLTEENAKDVREVGFHSDIYVAKTGKFYLKVDNKVTSVAMPEALVDRIKDSTDKGIDVTPLIKFWIRFLRNHKLRNICKTQEAKEAFAARVFNYVNLDFTNEEVVHKLIEEKGYTKEVAREMATVKQVKISKEGLLQTFKVSKEITKRYRLNDKGERESYDVYAPKVVGIDPITGLYVYDDKKVLINEDRVFEPAIMGTGGDEFFCGDVKGHIIRVGQVHRLESWKQINTDDHSSCVPGLHFGGLSYIKGYQSEGTETHNILCSPEHIGAVPCDTSGAIRCTQYYVLDAFSGVNGSIYHSSTYGKMTDDQWAEEKAEILKEFGELQQKRTEDLESSLV
jgi:hypothetical protein